MIRWQIVLMLFICVIVSNTLAEEPQKPASEVKQLGFYVGKWNELGESRPSGAEAFGKLSGHESCEWFSGGFAVVCRESTMDRSGNSESLYILAYDPGKKVYTVYGTDQTGTIYSGTGTLENGTWRWTAEARWQASTMQMRYTFNSASGGGRTMQVEIAEDDGKWSKIIDVTYMPAN
jgi:uncharacterized protein DUF1579